MERRRAKGGGWVAALEGENMMREKRRGEKKPLLRVRECKRVTLTFVKDG